MGCEGSERLSQARDRSRSWWWLIRHRRWDRLPGGAGDNGVSHGHRSAQDYASMVRPCVSPNDIGTSAERTRSACIALYASCTRQGSWTTPRSRKAGTASAPPGQVSVATTTNFFRQTARNMPR